MLSPRWVEVISQWTPHTDILKMYFLKSYFFWFVCLLQKLCRSFFFFFRSRNFLQRVGVIKTLHFLKTLTESFCSVVSDNRWTTFTVSVSRVKFLELRAFLSLFTLGECLTTSRGGDESWFLWKIITFIHHNLKFNKLCADESLVKKLVDIFIHHRMIIFHK